MSEAYGVSNGHGNNHSHKESSNNRWETEDRRRSDEHHSHSASRRPRHSRSRSPRRSRRSKSRSRSPRPNGNRHERRSSRSPTRHKDGDRSHHKWGEHPTRSNGFSSRGRGHPDEHARRAMGRETAAIEASKRSIKENRVYVGNLAFSVKWSDLKDFMREGGLNLLERYLIPSKPLGRVICLVHLSYSSSWGIIWREGCGVVEFSTRAEAERAVKELNDTPLLGRQVFVREDREEEARYGPLAVSGFGARGGHAGGFGTRGSHNNGYGGGPGGLASAQPCKQLAISGLPYNVGWQDLKDMFRSAGSIVRADVYFGADGSPTGNAMFNGFEYEGRTMEVREDRAASANSGFRGGLRGGFGGGGFGARGGRGGFRGGSSGYGGGRDTNNLYDDYSGQDGSSSGAAFGAGGFRGGRGGPPGGPGMNIQPNQQIFVKNLPWSTSNDDLVELFQTTGKVQNAEVLLEGGRSKGVGVVEFETVEEAETAIAKFQDYSYGGRPLSLEFNGRWRDFSAVAPGSAGL